MIYEPSYMNPYLGDVDGSIANTFSCIVNADGGSKIVGYKIVISDLSGNNIYTPSTQTLTTPLYSGQQLNVIVPSNSGMVNGSDYVWNISLYGEYNNIWVTSGNIVSSTSATSFVLPPSMLIKAGMYININNQARQILSYNSETGATTTSEFSSAPATGDYFVIYSNYITSVDSFFKARSTPTLSINTIPNPITSKNYTFTGTYTQSQNVQYKYFRWVMYDVGNNIIGDSGEITTGNIEYAFDGFINNSTYGIKLLIETQDGQSIQTNIEYFDISYPDIQIVTNAIGESSCDKSANIITWKPPVIEVGVQTGTGRYLDNTPFLEATSLQLDAESMVEWNLSQYDNWYYDSTTLINWTTDIIPEQPLQVIEMTQTPMDLLTISNTIPFECSVGDYYYNSTTKLIYIATESNVWATTGTTPEGGRLYKNLNDGQIYIWDDNVKDMVVNTYESPSYSVTYMGGTFYYTIKNKNINISSSVVVNVEDTLWLLQPSQYSSHDNFIWDDTAVWNDDYFFAMKTSDFMNFNWAKITLLPTEMRVVTNSR